MDEERGLGEICKNNTCLMTESNCNGNISNCERDVSSDIIMKNKSNECPITTAVAEKLDFSLNDNKLLIDDILNHVQCCPAVFKAQQIGDPELTEAEKRSLAEDLIKKNPSNFLTRFAPFLNECHFDYFLSSDNTEVVEYAKQLRTIHSHKNRKTRLRNRRYGALKRLEAEGTYFSEAEMEKREPLLYHQLVSQFLSEKEKMIRSGQNKSQEVPSLSKLLMEKMERDEIIALRKSQEEAEEKMNVTEESEDENSSDPVENVIAPRWGDDWIDAENAKKQKCKKKSQVQKKINLSSKEKALLLAEFKSLMHSKFLNGLESEFNYDDVDLNPEYDCLQIRSQDEEDKYFDDESCDNDICTDTGIEDY